MAIREKLFIPENIYFITFTILEWKIVFTDDRYFNLVYKWFDYIKEKYGNKINGYVIMPNHIHVLMYISKKSQELSKLIQNAKRFLAYGVVDLLEKDSNKNILEFFAANAEVNKGAKHKVFENRFDAKLMDMDLFLQKLEYIHNNPCQEKWRLVDAPEDYKHSSASNYFLGKGIYEVEIIN